MKTLRELRVERGMSLRQLEHASGINRAILSQIERGRMVAEPREIQAIAVALGVPMLGTRTMLVEGRAS